MAKKNNVKKVAPKKSSKNSAPKRPNINLLVSMAVLAVSLGLLLFQIQMNQDMRGKAQITNCTVTTAQTQISSQEQALFDQINAYRQQQGRDVLTWDSNLNRAAAWMSRDMITRGNVGHMDSLGRTVEQRFPACGVSNTQNYGENVISGAPQADEILAGWKIDPPDNTALLNANFSVGAVAMELDGTGQIAYWTFTASGPPLAMTATSGPSPTGIPIVTEPSSVPSPACLGGVCPTNPGGNPVMTTTASPTQPGQATPTTPAAPTDDPDNPGGGSPTLSGTIIPTETPLDPSGNPISPTGGPGDNPGGGGEGGIIALFLAFLALIIQFFLSLFGR